MIEIRSRIDCVVGDLSRAHADAIVNAASPSLRGGGGVDGALHRAAGPELLHDCVTRYPTGCAVGDVAWTEAYDLSARYVLHTPGPVYIDGNHGEPDQLASCYAKAVALAADLGCSTVAAPAISCGVYGYPMIDGARVALSSVAAALAEHPSVQQVRFVLMNHAIHAVFEATHRAMRI